MKTQHLTSMIIRLSSLLLAAALLPFSVTQAAEFTGRFSLFGSVGQAAAGDIGYVDKTNRTLGADQQSLRLMLDDFQAQSEWSVHLKTRRQHQLGFPVARIGSSDVFRFEALANDLLDHQDSDSATLVGYEIDRAVYKRNFKNLSMSLGRQPIDWGSGRFWQPLNVFGAFAPTDLDTDFKPGIDAALGDWYPSSFSSVTAAYVLGADNLGADIPGFIGHGGIKDSGAIYYKRQAGSNSEMSIMAGSVIGNDVIGASFESEWAGMGWRLEGRYSHLDLDDENEFFWIAGIDYQFTEGTLVAVEWYDNSAGASHEASLLDLQLDREVALGLQPQLGRRIFGITAQRDITPLLNGNYTILASSLRDLDNQSATSVLHQLNLIYSVSDESDLLLSLLYANGKGLSQAGQPQSEFGHIPASITLRLRFYF